MEAGSDLEQAADAAADPHPAGAGLGDPAQDLEQRALPRAVAPDDADRLAGLDVEVDVFERPEPLRGSHAATGDAAGRIIGLGGGGRADLRR